MVKETAPGVLFAPAAPGNSSELTTIALKTEPVHLLSRFFLQSYPPLFGNAILNLYPSLIIGMVCHFDVVR
ncbi:hypothetical protein C3733_06260 [Bacillus amyloliquefaciens]|nr:hypothetical protein C3733_06260 [Bacillus amyloliquefaciens]